MKKNKILTLTVNPAVDKSTKFAGLIAEQKIRCQSPKYDAGGGGINVSKAVSRLGGSSIAVFTSGGHSGILLENLVSDEKIVFEAIKIKESTRENFIVVDTYTNAQYRFGMPGPFISKDESQAILDKIIELQPDYLVASGSLTDGIGDDFYEKIAKIAHQNNAKFILDSSGNPLKLAVDEGVYLLKPNISELAKLIGVENIELDEVDEAAQMLINQKGCNIVVVSLGSQGAIMATKNKIKRIFAPSVHKKSTVGAGDSMVGGLVWALVNNQNPIEATQLGVACGSAATMNDGTQLFKKNDALRLLQWIKSNS